MKNIIYTLLFSILSTFHLSAANNAIDSFFSEADSFFKSSVLNGSVNYAAIKKDFGKVESLYAQIGKMDLSGASATEKKAFYINAYNVIVIYQVTKYYPLKSPMDQSGFFDKVKHKVAGEDMTLNYLEIKKIIIPYRDARIHFALACAAKGCPKLANFAYTPDNLDQQLTTRSKLALNDPSFTKVNKAQKKVEISKIFDWYKKDFTQGGNSVLSFINQYRKDAIPTGFSISYYEYDWRLNDTRN